MNGHYLYGFTLKYIPGPPRRIEVAENEGFET